MIKIRLPQKFQDKLSEVQELEGIVMSTISEFGDILIDNKLFFFEEYTDHGVRHIENVLESSSNLITEKTFSTILSASDIACYVLSVVLHDIAMHISLDGFNQLLNGEFDKVRISEFDKLTWKELWDEYLNETKKFSGKQLNLIFGDQNLIVRKPPLLNIGEINGNDKKLIGEFIRRHHTRLAHEIALVGFPGRKGTLHFANGLDDLLKQLVGVIARSHGLDLRRCIDYVEVEYGKNTRRHINGIHLVFLMILLRLSDYLQIDKSRASTTLLKVKTFSSPFSEFEHKAHLSINYIDDKYQNDPERIFVNASPTESSMYLKIKKLIQDIQYEFDISWAVLGEIYGEIENKPEIKYRRITSNLEDQTFYSKQQYVADKFYFKANDEVVKLLIAPLYGNDSKYGVRELLQNAVDACKEREIIENLNQDSKYQGEIEVNVYKDENDDAFFSITDNGTGMSIDIIKDYFLTAGASYRKSFDWQKTFIDSTGNSNVNRSGQFGVGVLAAFLIGKSIYVETKSIKSITGYKFYADLASDQINIIKDDSIKSGTKIIIKIDDDKRYQFAPRTIKTSDNKIYDWTEWYMLPKPQIKYFFLGQEISPTAKLGPDEENPAEEWRTLNSVGYNKILWAYDESYEERKFICNGILVNEVFDIFDETKYLDLSPFKDPLISVFDNNGILPLTLDRENLSDYVSFREDLKEDICKDFLAHVLLFTPGCQAKESTIQLGTQLFNYPGAVYDEIDHYFISKKGFLLKTDYSIRKSGLSTLIELKSTNLHEKFNEVELDIKDAFFEYSIIKSESQYNFNSEFWHLKYSEENGRKITRPLDVRVFLGKKKFNDLFNTNKKRIPTWAKKESQLEFEKHNIVCLKFQNPNESLITEHFLKKYQNEIKLIKEYSMPERNFPDDVIDNLIEKYLGDNVVIPYSLKERIKLYPLAFKELEYYMRKHMNNHTF
ncbi:hypothetical protein HHL17_24760 [Chitinophaga sp. G-6-1-13]|uniref:HD-CE domain-containing protein n=1 Tax=Chitinophaga fulva TaxID=2728842 RepID=A0A848GTI2_9BACT|nr:ATP-binding protein [Chitinophaga fulva]NML40432.1 hypothetical protein [Chitinophaga fulva]